MTNNNKTMTDYIKDKETGYVHNCHLKHEDGDMLFSVNSNGDVIATLDRYAIVPRDEYEKLISIAHSVKAMDPGFKKVDFIELAKEVLEFKPQEYKQATNDTNL